MGDCLRIFCGEAPFEIRKSVVHDNSIAVNGADLHLLTVQTDFAADMRLTAHDIGAAVVICGNEVSLAGNNGIRFDICLADRDIPAVFCGECDIF